jgi:acetolactate synthase-1/2/3 large subunit
MIKVADLFIKALENEEVEYIFGLPGEENLDILEAIGKSKIKFVLTHDERSAAFMAATYGRLTGRAGVCLTTLGPGATNLTTGLAYANLGAMPMLAITGQKPIKASQQGKFQILDIVRMVEPLTKYSKSIAYGSQVSSVIREAFRTAEEERPGAVHIELPEDVAKDKVDNYRIFPRQRIHRTFATDRALNIATDAIRQAKKPLLLVGADANRKNVCHIMQNFIDQTDIMFFNTQMGKGVVNIDNNNNFMGTAALSSDDYLHKKVIAEADLIINIGHDIVEKPPFLMKGDEQIVIHINFNSAQVRDIYYPQIEVIGNIKHTVEKLTEKLQGFKCPNLWAKGFQAQIRDIIHKYDDNNSFPIKPQRLVADVRKVMADEDIVCLDNGMFKVWFARHYHTHRVHTLLLDNALATMGAGLPSAIATKIIKPEQKVLAVCGDGGLMMSISEIETAKRLGAALVVLVLVDNAYGMIKWKQKNQSLDDFGLDFTNPDFVKLANSYGLSGFKVEKTEDFIPTLNKAFATNQVSIVEIAIDYSENDFIYQSVE